MSISGLILEFVHHLWKVFCILPGKQLYFIVVCCYINNIVFIFLKQIQVQYPILAV